MIEATLKRLDCSGMVAMWAILATMLPEKKDGIKAQLAAEDPQDIHRAITSLRALEEDAEQEGHGESCRSATALLESLIG